MALGTNPFAAATVVAMVPEVWTPMVLEELFAKTVAANFFTDLSSYAQGGGDIFHVPDVFTNTFTTQTQSTQGTEVTLSNPAQVDVTLTVNTHNYIAFQVGDKDLTQLANDYDFNGVYARKIGSQLADALEDAIFALWSGLSTNAIGDTATVLSDAEIRQGVNALDAANFDLRECAFFFHPYTFWIQLGAVAKYYDMSQAAGYAQGKGSFIREGNWGPMDASRGLKGQLYGIPVFTSSNVVSGLQTYRNILAHKTAFGFAVQTPGGNKVRIQMENRLEFLSSVCVADILFGVVEMRDAAGVLLNGSSAFIGS